MKRICSYLIVLVSVVLAGCASGPSFKEASSSFAPLAADKGRIYFYRTAIVGAAVQPAIYLNENAVGKATPKGFFYIDMAPGNYEVKATTEAENKLTFTLEAGQTRYVRLDMRMGLFVGHVVPILVDSKEASDAIQETSYTGKGSF